MTHSLTIDEFLLNPKSGLSEFISVNDLRQTIEESDWNLHQSVLDHTLKVFDSIDRVISLELPHLELLTPIKPDIVSYVDSMLGNHSRRVLLKVSSLLHDLGKVSLIRTGERWGTACPGHAEESRKIFESAGHVLPLPLREHNYVASIIGKHHDAEHFVGCQSMEQCEAELERYRRENEGIIIDLLLFYLCDFEGSKINLTVERQKPFIFRKICGVIFDIFMARKI